VRQVKRGTLVSNQKTPAGIHTGPLLRGVVFDLKERGRKKGGRDIKDLRKLAPDGIMWGKRKKCY